MRGQNKVECMRNGRWKENIHYGNLKRALGRGNHTLEKEKFKSHMSSQTQRGLPYTSRKILNRKNLIDFSFLMRINKYIYCKCENKAVFLWTKQI